MELSEVSSVTQDYLKNLWTAREWRVTPVTISQLSQRLGVSPSSASEVVARLASQGLVSHERYGGVDLTESGTKLALAMVRRHRLLETFLAQILGYTWDEVHEEAEILEHAVSDSLVARIDAFLGHPSEDPHGDPIPTVEGSVSTPDHVALVDMPVGTRCVVARIRDTDPEVLRFLSEHGVSLGETLEVTRLVEVADLMEIRIEATGQDVSLGTRIASLIRVYRAASAE